MTSYQGYEANAPAAWRRRYQARMEVANELKVRDALARGLVVRCPVCGILHPAMRYLHPQHREFCSRACFRQRDRDRSER